MRFGDFEDGEMVANERRMLGIEILAREWPKENIIGLGGGCCRGQREGGEKTRERKFIAFTWCTIKAYTNKYLAEN